MYKKKAGKLQTGITFPKQYWLAVNGKPKIPLHIRNLPTIYQFNKQLNEHLQSL